MIIYNKAITSTIIFNIAIISAIVIIITPYMGENRQQIVAVQLSLFILYFVNILHFSLFLHLFVKGHSHEQIWSFMAIYRANWKHRFRADIRRNRKNRRRTNRPLIFKIQKRFSRLRLSSRQNIHEKANCQFSQIKLIILPHIQKNCLKKSDSFF